MEEQQNLSAMEMGPIHEWADQPAELSLTGAHRVPSLGHAVVRSE